MTPTEKLEAYLKPLLLALGFTYVEFADGETIDRFNEDSVRKSCYPGAFVIASDYRIQSFNEGNEYANFKTTFYFLVKKIQTNSENLFADENTAFNLAESKSINVYKKLRIEDRIAHILFPQDSEWHAQRVKDVTADMAVGYEVTTHVSIPITELLCS